LQRTSESNICKKKTIKGDGFKGIATTEADGGSDVANVKSTGRKQGDYWILNGEQLHTSGTEEAKKWGGGYFASATLLLEPCVTINFN